ncbi:MAG: hypothetical protein ACREC6_05055 [Hyphomicrobiaceae bacterium]
MWLFKTVLALVVLVCIGASATFAFEFGWTRGATDVHRWTYALASVAIDLLKAGMPILGAMAWHDRDMTRSFACWLVFVCFTAFSLWCAYGMTATQLAEKIGDRITVEVDLKRKESSLDALRAQRDALPKNFTPATEEGVAAARSAADRFDRRWPSCPSRRSRPT